MTQSNNENKITKEEIKKSRKIVLDYIGEEDELVNKTDNKQSSQKLFTTSAKNKPEPILEKKSLSEADKKKAKDALGFLSKDKKIESKTTSETNNQLKKASIKTELIPAKEDLASQQSPKIKIGDNKNQKDNKKTSESSKTKKNIVKKKVKSKHKKRRVKSKKQKKDIPIKNQKRTTIFLNIFSETKFIILKNRQNIFYTLFGIIGVVIVLYCLYAFILLKLNLDNKVFRSISKFAPVPAAITSDGYLEYFDYKDLVKNIGNQNKKTFVTKEVVLLNLLSRYKISGNLENQEIVDIINHDFSNDKNLNPNGISLSDYLNKQLNKKILFLVK